QYVSKKTGVNLNIQVPAGDASQKLNTMMASGKLPDIITLAWDDDGTKKLIEGGLVEPLDKLAKDYDPYFFKVADAEKVSWYTEPDGHFYGYPNASSSPKDFAKYKEVKPSNQTFLVRKDMYEAIGKPDMRTPEGFLKALKMAKEKYPSVNEQPLIPLGLNEFTNAGNTSLETYLQNYLAIPCEKDGNLYDRTSDPEYLNWLKTFRVANSEGLLSKDVFIDKRPQMEEKIAQGRYFAMIYQRSDMAAQQKALYNKDKNSVYIAVDGPSNSNLDAPKLAGDGISGWTVTMISKTCKDKARAIKFLTYLITEEGQKDLYLGEKGVTYDSIDGKDKFKPEALTMLNADRSAFDKKYGAAIKFWMLMDTNMILKWAPTSIEPVKQMEDFTKGKTFNYSQFENINPKNDSNEGVSLTRITDLWGTTLPKLLMAKSNSEFDTIFNDFITKRSKLGYDSLLSLQQKKFEENKKKLDIKQ
ncbi:MAG: extracellular solute-binding protein, partial [Clostridiaceae bacterium]|nr:extracellular solute-binding protein [Clostridiaceae bacterium]